MSDSNPYSSKEAWLATLHSAFNGPQEQVESTFLKLYTKETVIKMDGKTYDWDAFMAHVAWIRDVASNIEIKSHCFLRDGNMLADKHTLTATMKNDAPDVVVEAYLFGELDDDGKAVWVDEQARTLGQPGAAAEKPGTV